MKKWATRKKRQGKKMFGFGPMERSSISDKVVKIAPMKQVGEPRGVRWTMDDDLPHTIIVTSVGTYSVACTGLLCH